MTDYPALYKRLAQEILKQEGKIGADASVFVGQFVKSLRASGLLITPEIEQHLSDYLTAMQQAIKVGITSTATLAVGHLPALAKSETVAKLVEQAYTQRWPDGLTLSKRLWRWDDRVRSGLTDTLKAGIKHGQAVNSIVYDMQRSIEKDSGKAFKIVQIHQDDWVKELHESAIGLIHDPAGKQLWDETVADVEERLLSLRESGTKHAAERVFSQIQAAVTQGSEELADKAVKWWMYDKQLYHIKRIARTEMATAMHQGVIAGTIEDDTIIGYQWRLSASHPRTDICDYYADIDMGLGRGVFDKESVPPGKAHPHCMCLLVPRVTPVASKGKKNYAEFVQSLPQQQRDALLPKWASRFTELGMPLDKLIKPNGIGLLTKQALQDKLGADKYHAADTLSKALVDKKWPENKLKLKMPQTKDTLASLQQHKDVPEVAKILAELEKSNKVDSRQWHYMRYKYHFGDDLKSPRDLDKRFDAVLQDKQADIYQTQSGRLAVVSKKEGRMGLVHNDGARVTVYQYNDKDLHDLDKQHGQPIWKIKNLWD
jgi:hypothetical protein